MNYWSLALKRQLLEAMERRHIVDSVDSTEQHLVRIVEDDSQVGPDERLLSDVTIGPRRIRVVDTRPPRSKARNQVARVYLPDNGRGDCDTGG